MTPKERRADDERRARAIALYKEKKLRQGLPPVTVCSTRTAGNGYVRGRLVQTARAMAADHLAERDRAAAGHPPRPLTPEQRRLYAICQYFPFPQVRQNAAAGCGKLPR